MMWFHLVSGGSLRSSLNVFIGSACLAPLIVRIRQEVNKNANTGLIAILLPLLSQLVICKDCNHAPANQLCARELMNLVG